MHQSPGSYLTPVLQNEDTVMTAGKQNGIPTEDTFRAAPLPASWGRAFISGTIMRGGPVAEVQSFLFRNPTSQSHWPRRHGVDTSQALRNSSPSDHSLSCVCVPFLFLFFFLSFQKWLFRYRLEPAGRNVGFLKPHVCFSSVPRRILIFSVITNLI